MYFSHRIIWAWVYGEWPKQTLDHINRNRLDNRIVNLREADHGLQMRNSRILKGNTSGVKGVHWENGRNRWRASMHWDKKVVCLGYFRTKADAIATRHAAMIERFGVDYDT
jgi:hypothetical protein